MNELSEARLDLLDAVKDVDDNRLHACNADGWSILHVLEHLYLMEKSTIKGIETALRTSDPCDISSKPIRYVLDRSRKVKTPDFAEPRGAFKSLAEAATHLAASRAELETLMGSIKNEEVLDTHGFRHPFFGTLSIRQWLDIVPLHERRHLAQIEEMKSQLNQRQN